MANFINLFNEVSPEQTTVRVFVETKNGRATIKNVEAQNSLQLLEPISPASWINTLAVSPGAQILNFISPNISEQPADFNAAVSLTRVPQEVVFLDVGRWGGPKPSGAKQRNFGLVWSTFVVLCEFESKDPQLDTDAHLLRDDAGVVRPNNPINDFLRAVRSAGSSVRVHKSLNSTNPNFNKGWTQNQTDLYIIIPDLHLPVCTSKPKTSDGPHMGRHSYLAPDPASGSFPDNEGMVIDRVTLLKRFGFFADFWFDRYLNGDIFGGPEESAAQDMDRFLGVLEAMTFTAGITPHFVQIGDMYDLWIGLERFFSEQATHSVVLRNGTDRQKGILAGVFIDFWADRTHLAMQAKSGANIVARLNRLNRNAKFKTSWLFGNHDNYLSAHPPVTSVGEPVPRRKREVHEGGILIEHGQRGDPDNRDGSISGHKTTNDVFDVAPIRKLDPNRRNFFTALAATTYVSKPDFHMFVMGHTHSPYLTRLRIETVLLKP
jgi:hypothetical protein